jgi:hypothetical protein
MAQLVNCVAHGVVLDGGGDDVVATPTPPGGPGHASQRYVVRLGAGSSEDYLGGTTAQHIGDGLASLL